MENLIWAGAAISLAGVGLLLWCALAVVRARRAGLSDLALRARLQQIVAYNLAALGISVLGLMLVILGIAFG